MGPASGSRWGLGISAHLPIAGQQRAGGARRAVRIVSEMLWLPRPGGRMETITVCCTGREMLCCGAAGGALRRRQAVLGATCWLLLSSTPRFVAFPTVLGL